MPRVASTSVAERRAEQRAAAEQRIDDIGDIHAEHDEIAMREIHDVHHAPDQGQPGGKQRVDGSEQEAADDHLDKYEGHGLSASFRCSRRH